MDRRTYLGAIVATGIAGAAGCLDSLSAGGDDSGDDATVLGPPERSRGDPSHPIHGEEFPDFSIQDPLAGSAVSLDDFEGERAFLMTFIFTSCVDECSAMMRTLQLVQEDATREGYADDVAFLAVTFDPETDDADALREYGEQHDVDFDAGNWHFLRPETQDEAITLVNDRFGAPIDIEALTESHDEGEHDHENGNDDHGDGHDHENGSDDESDGGGSSVHYPMILLVNERGITERSYPPPVGATPNDIIEDTRTVVE